ncbi:hypothetical protein Bca101_020272 [Brassica carinata]
MANKKCELCDGLAAASPRRSIVTTTARPVGFHRAANPASSSSVIHHCFSSESVETIVKKKVEDVMPLQLDTRRRSLKLNLRGGGCLTLTFLKVPSEQGAARIGAGGDSCLVSVQPY